MKLFYKLLTILLFSSQFVLSQATFMSITNGNWNDNGTWLKLSGTDEDGIPDANDSVRIAIIQTDTITVPSATTVSCAKLEIGSYVTATGGLLELESSTSLLSTTTLTIFQSTDLISRTLEINAGTVSVSQNLTFEDSNASANRNSIVIITSGTLSVGGNITFHSPLAANAILDMTGGAGRLNLGGSFILDSAGTISTAGSGTIINYNGTVSQVIAVGSSNFVYENLYINNTSPNGAVLDSNITTIKVTGDLKIQSGKLRTGSFSITGNAGKIFSVDSGATFVIGEGNSTQGFPTGFGTVTLNSSSTVIYGGGSQTIYNPPSGYGNLTLESGSGIATKTLPNSELTVVGGFTIQAGSNTVIASALANIVVGKDVTIGPGAVMNLGNFSHSVGGNWLNTGGLYSASASTVTFNGNGAQAIAGPTFNNIIFSGSGIKSATAGLAISGTVTINNGTTFNAGSFDHSVQKNWVKNGSFSSAGKITFNGTSSQSIDSSSFYHLAFSNAGVKTPNAPFTISKEVTINSGATFDGASMNHSVGGSWTNNGTFLYSGTTITFTGTDSQYVTSTSFNHFVVNKTGGVVILRSEVDIEGNLTLSAGTFDAAGFTFERTTEGGTLTMGANTTLKIGGTNTFPDNYASHTLASSSTIEYSGDDQLITLAAYKNLVLSGERIKTLDNNIGVEGKLTVRGSATLDPLLFVVTGGGTDSLISFGTLRVPQTTLSNSYTNFVAIALKTGNIVEYSGGNQTVDTTVTYYGIGFSGTGTKTLLKGLSLAGNFNIDAVTVNAGTFSNTIGGNWTILGGGIFNSTGTVTFNGTTQTVSATSFNNVAFSGSGTKYLTGNVTTGGTFTISSSVTVNAGNATHSVQGNFVVNGTLLDSTSTFMFNGSSAQLIGNGTFQNFILNNPNGASLTKSITVQDTLKILSGNLSTNADSIFLSSTGTLLESAGSLVLGKIRTTRVVLQNVSNTFGGLGLEVNAIGAAPGQTTLTRRTGTALNGTGSFSSHRTIKRYFDVSPAVNSNLNAVVKFSYDTSDIGTQLEEKFSLWRSSNVGSTWIRIPSDVDTANNLITVDSLSSLHRLTAADSANALTPVSVTVRKFRDTDGIISSTTNWQGKKWNLLLYKDSVTATPYSAVISDSILSLNNLTEGFYIVKEADSAGWKHLGYRKNFGTPVSDTSTNSVSFYAYSGETHTVDFVNFIPNTVVVKKVQDLDINFSTRNDRVAKPWKMMLYRGSISSGTIIDSVQSDTMLVVSNLGDGRYIAKEADSAGWGHLGGILDTTQTAGTGSSITIDIAGGQTKTATFVNKHPAKLIMLSYREKDGDTLTTSDWTLKKWGLSIYKDSISSSTLIKTTHDDSMHSGDIAPGTYIAVVADSTGNWSHFAVVRDSIQRNGNFNTDTVTLVEGQTRTVKFIHYNYNSITIRAYDDDDGDVNSSADRVALNWHLQLYKDSISATSLLQEVTSDTQISISNLSDAIYYAIQSDSTNWTDLRTVVTNGTKTTLLSSDTVTLRLDTLKGGNNVVIQFLHFKPEKSRYRTFTQTDYTTKSVKLKVKKGLSRPMPTAGNIRDTATAKNAKKSPITVGLARTDSAKVYGWLVFTSGNNIRASLPDTGRARGLDSLGTKKLKPIVKKQKSLKPKYHNNRLLGELITLKTNIAASDVFVTNAGFGDLLYYDSTNLANPANGKTIRQIGTTLDTMMTYWKLFAGSPLYATFDTILNSINVAFTDTMDTVTATPLKIKGTKRVQDVAFLHKVETREAVEIPVPYDPPFTPTVFDLQQNFPNPFNPVTTIPFLMADDGFVTIVAYNILGQEIMKIIDNEFYLLGEREVEFDASLLSSGIYFTRLYVNGNLEGRTLRMILLK